MKNFYELLQVFPTATTQEVKDAFRFLLFRYHPDHNKGREDWAVQRTMEIVEAYHVLSDGFRRAHHDVMRGVKLRDVPPKKGGLGALFGKATPKNQAAEESFKRGLDAFKTGEFEQAVLAFKRAYELDSDFPGLRYNMAVSLLALERGHDAVQWLQDHVSRVKDDAEGRALLVKLNALQSKKKSQGA